MHKSAGWITVAHYGRKTKPYYLGQFVSVAGGQKAITLTAVKNKSFEGEQVWISILEYFFSTRESGYDAFSSFKSFTFTMKYANLSAWLLRICCCFCAQSYADCHWTVHIAAPQFILVWLSCMSLSGGSENLLIPSWRILHWSWVKCSKNKQKQLRLGYSENDVGGGRGGKHWNANGYGKHLPVFTSNNHEPLTFIWNI